MKIATNVIVEHGTIVAVTFYNTHTLEFEEERVEDIRYKNWYNRLPMIDGFTMAVVKNPGRCTIIGRDIDMIVISSGMRDITKIKESQVFKCQPVNLRIERRKGERTLVINEGKIPDLHRVFENNTFEVCEYLNNMLGSSGGMQRKYYGYKKGTQTYGIIKYPLMRGSKDIEYEVLYKKVGDVLGVPVVRAIMGEYNKEKCVLSVFEYDKTSDNFITLYRYMRNNKLSVDDVIEQLKDGKETYIKYMIMDYIMVQEDRHFRNIAICNNRLYPLYDNGRCLGNGVIGTISKGNRNLVERNIKEWSKEYPWVSQALGRIKDVEYVIELETGDKNSKEYEMIERNMCRLKEMIKDDRNIIRI